MVDVWEGIDPAAAEARLRGLRRRLSELDEALADQQALARSIPESFGIALSGESLRSIEAGLRRELFQVLRYRKAELIAIFLDGPRYTKHSARLSDLGVIFTRLQKVFSSIAQSIKEGPTTRGPIRSEIMIQTAMRLQSTYPSSFGMSVIVPAEFDLLGTSLSSDALSQMFQILFASKDEDKLMRVSGEIGRRSLVHLRHLARHLIATDSVINFDWRDYTGTQYEWYIDRRSADQIISLVDNITETRSETKKFEGWLVGASLLRNRFELLLDGGEVVEGKFVGGLGETMQNVFGKFIYARIDETEISDRISGEIKTFYTLVAVKNRENDL